MTTQDTTSDGLNYVQVGFESPSEEICAGDLCVCNAVHRGAI